MCPTGHFVYLVIIILVLIILLGWSDGVKVLCILCHRGVQLILAYSWARPAIIVAGNGREVMFLFLLFLHFHSVFLFLPCGIRTKSLLLIFV